MSTIELTKWGVISLLPCHSTFINSLTPGKSEYNNKHAIVSLVLLIHICRSCYHNAPRLTSGDFTDDKPTLVQVMPFGNWPLPEPILSSMSPYGVTRPQWVNDNFQNTKSWTQSRIQFFRKFHILFSVIHLYPLYRSLHWSLVMPYESKDKGENWLR